jgi:hypothetical protein
MTYWATLWYSGFVVLTIGYDGQTAEQCEELADLMLSDINSAYQEEITIIENSMFPENEFYVTCEDELLPIDREFRE